MGSTVGARIPNSSNQTPPYYQTFFCSVFERFGIRTFEHKMAAILTDHSKTELFHASLGRIIYKHYFYFYI